MAIMEYTKGVKAQTDADNLLSGTGNVSSVKFGTGVIETDGLDFETAFSTLSQTIVTDLEAMVKNMKTTMDLMKEIDGKVYGYEKVPLDFTAEGVDVC